MKRSTITLAAATVVVATALAVALTGCTAGSTDRGADGGLSGSYENAKGQGYVSGDGSVVTIAPEKRAAAPTWSAKDTAGASVSTASLKGEVAVLNFWFAGCGPCRLEAPALKDLSGELQPKGVRFVGVNTRDDASQAAGFTTKFGIDYPTVLDQDDNTIQLAYAGDVPANAVPTTLVLDAKGRVAARFSGEISSPTELLAIVDDVRAGR